MTSRSLKAQLGKRLALVTFCSLSIMVALLAFLMHQTMHRQTDALLLHLAHAEATNIVEEGSGFHVHSMAIHLPALTGGLRERYAIVFDTHGRILDLTHNLIASQYVPEEWFSPSEPDQPRYFNSKALSKKLLRLVVLPMEYQGERAFVGVGVAHQDLDAALWSFVGLAIPFALLAALLVTLAGVWLIRRHLVNLSTLSDACLNLDVSSGKINIQAQQPAFQVPEQAAEEFQLLAHTLRDLLDKVQSLLETQNRFVAEAAHELRTPLTSLRGDLELALRRNRPETEYREFITDALGDVGRLQKLAGDLLEGARGRHGRLNLEDLPLSALVHEALGQRKKELEKANLTISLMVSEDLHVMANHQATLRIIANLIDNATVHSQGTQLHFSSEILDSQPILRISDDGKGIPPALKGSLFHPFQRDSQKGFGLGLYIAFQLMQAQGGNLSLAQETTPHRGACWELRFRSAPP